MLNIPLLGDMFFLPRVSKLDSKEKNMSNIKTELTDELHQSTAMSGPERCLEGLRILVIEDNALTRLAMESVLTSWGCLVTLAAGALMACDKVRHAETPDIILSDYQLNDGYNGIKAIRLVRELTGSQVPACLISADADQTVAIQAQAEGVDFLQKPVPPATLRRFLVSNNRHPVVLHSSWAKCPP
ncbi:MAG: response regulator [Comamonadaceae bacterium]|nr:MAG: response regulator [Comamonadaceae bacterium]